jgi:hypothetical protein
VDRVVGTAVGEIGLESDGSAVGRTLGEKFGNITEEGDGVIEDCSCAVPSPLLPLLPVKRIDVATTTGIKSAIAMNPAAKYFFL